MRPDSRGVTAIGLVALAALLPAMLVACGTLHVQAVEVTGIVVRGPVMPVCQQDVPCDAPFAATFDVLRAERPVASFTSDSNGAFRVLLAPGGYDVVPRATAPLMNPTVQRKRVDVPAEGLSGLRLEFDTGIR